MRVWKHDSRATSLYQSQKAKIMRNKKRWRITFRINNKEFTKDYDYCLYTREFMEMVLQFMRDLMNCNENRWKNVELIKIERTDILQEKKQREELQSDIKIKREFTS